MKAIAYNIDPKEKEWLIQSNHKKHDITIVSNSLTLGTAGFSTGKEALIVFNRDVIDVPIIKALKANGIKYIASSSHGYDHIDLHAAKLAGIKVAHIPFEDGSGPANIQQVITNLDNWAAGNCVGKACCCQKDCAIKG